MDRLGGMVGIAQQDRLGTMNDPRHLFPVVPGEGEDEAPGGVVDRLVE